jgi:hypothetical protein
MEKFMLIFHSPYSQETAFAEQSPEQLQAEIEKWNQWIGGIAAQGKILSTEALLPVGKTMTRGGQLITDGPYTEGKEIVGGYALISASNLEEATRLSQGCPILESAGTVEIRPVMKFDA